MAASEADGPRNAPCFTDGATTHVDDAIDGMLFCNPQLVELEGRREHGMRVIVRGDWSRDTTDHVAIVSGGGSGHEPAHAGYVGAGMLTAAVCGDVFASPSVAAVLAAIAATARPGGPGALLIVKNYTGDKLNFGLAAEKARAAGIAVRVVHVADDAAVDGGRITGRRGLAGTLLVHKCAGAAAARGACLSAVTAAAEAAAAAVATVGVSLTTCSVPGAPRSRRLDNPHTVELGLGIHGEPGREAITLPSATDLVDRVMTVLSAAPALSKPVEEGGSVPPLALLVNDLGACSGLEQAVIAGAAARWLSSRGRCVALAACIRGMTAIDMRGFSVTIMSLSPAVQELVEAGTEAPAWVPLRRPAAAPRTVPLPRLAAETSGADPWFPGQGGAGPPLDGAAARLAARCLWAAAAAVGSSEASLNALDAVSGDGDCGATASKGACAVAAVADASLSRAGVPSDEVSLMRREAMAVGRATASTLLPKFAGDEAKPPSAPTPWGADGSAAGSAAGPAADLTQLAALLRACEAAVSRSMGGSSGVIQALLFAAAAAAAAAAVGTDGGDGSGAGATAAGARGSDGAVSLAARAAKAGVAAVMAAGGASPGDGTMVDALFPAAEALERVALAGGSAVEAARAAADAAAAGAEATQGKAAAAGRASYVGTAEAAAAADPGAVAAALWVHAVASVLSDAAMTQG
ncbi:hypothetical protein FNF31_07398 [Cafeteria roenbergensis]|uniref:DhaK domain-containing protein n=2 Tax=Cafeteria roenbergensis TaxID=33653 RepID=A0A5A8C7L8_CAFRO|nr:hypothetical protein FNF31_07398 [Cafeteria roenbergensis]KAA0171296.1 hypothetical protein FNF28_00787 [Cafeteria roenbergensis]